MLNTTNPDYDTITFDFEQSFHSYLCTSLHQNGCIDMNQPIESSDSVFKYAVQKRTLDLFNPKDPTCINLLQVNTTAESIVIQAVHRALPEDKQTADNLNALKKCCYFNSSDFAAIAAKYNTPDVVVPLKDLFLGIDSTGSHVWEHLTA